MPHKKLLQPVTVRLLCWANSYQFSLLLLQRQPDM